MRSKIAVLSMLLALIPCLVFAASGQAAEISIPMMISGMVGGLALFLYGMNKMTESVKAAAGKNLQYILQKMTNNRFVGATVGAGVTGVIQSSSITTVLVVGFVSAGLMSLEQSIGIIIGANIGSTVTAQIIAFKVTKLALIFIGLGFFVSVLTKSEKQKNYATALMGLGMIFFGMTIMSDAMYPLRSHQAFIDMMVKMENPLFGIAAGMIFTGVVQSSAATVGIVIVLASQGLIGLEGGIAVALGANIGTCVTAGFAAIGKSRCAVRAALVHAIFNVLGVIIWIGFIDVLANMSTSISPSHASLTGLERVAAEVPRQIANANTLFNVINTFIFIWFTPQLARIAQKIVPDSRVSQTKVIEPKYLSDELLATPSAALEMVELEIARMSKRTIRMYESARRAMVSRERLELKKIALLEDELDILLDEIHDYLSKIGKQHLSEEESDRYYILTQSAAIIENVGDILEKGVSSLVEKMINMESTPSKTMLGLLEDLHIKVKKVLELGLEAVSTKNEKAAHEALSFKGEINGLLDQAYRRQSYGLATSKKERYEILRIEYEMIDKLKHIFSMSKRLCYLTLQTKKVAQNA